MGEKLVIKPYNSVFLIILIACIIILILGSIYLNRKSKKTREIVLSIFCLVLLVIYFIYKYEVSQDTAYAQLCLEAGTGSGEFNIASYLPLHLCNINLWLIPVAVLTRNKYLKAFPFYLGSIGALMALSSPGLGYSGYSLLLPRMWGFYITHYGVLMASLALVTLGLFKPTYKMIPKSLLFIEGINFAVFLVNLFLIYTGIYKYANFMFSISTSGNPILNIFYNILPVPFLYQNLLVVLLIPYMLIVTALYNLVCKYLLRKNKDDSNIEAVN